MELQYTERQLGWYRNFEVTDSEVIVTTRKGENHIPLEALSGVVKEKRTQAASWWPGVFVLAVALPALVGFLVFDLELEYAYLPIISSLFVGFLWVMIPKKFYLFIDQEGRVAISVGKIGNESVKCQNFVRQFQDYLKDLNEHSFEPAASGNAGKPLA
jgi:hypothetical protein